MPHNKALQSDKMPATRAMHAPDIVVYLHLLIGHDNMFSFL